MTADERHCITWERICFAGGWWLCGEGKKGAITMRDLDIELSRVLVVYLPSLGHNHNL
jgi:hypothetical protein